MYAINKNKDANINYGGSNILGNRLTNPGVLPMSFPPFLCASDAVIQMKPGLVFLSSTLPSLTLQSSVTRLTLRPATSYLPHRRYFFFPKRTPCQRKSLCSEPNSTTFAPSASLSSMSSAFHPEKARVPPAMQTPTPPITKFMIGLLQLKVTADKESNIVHARKAVEAAVKNGAKLVVLPEIWNSPYSNDSFPVYAEDIDAGFDASPSTAMLSEAAQLLNITIIGGSIPERNGDKLYNTCCVYGPDGKLKAKHRKIHLFDIDIPGKITFKESQTLAAGETPTVVDTEVGRIGIGICYDIRFQELAMLYAARGAQLICYPGAFNMTTGPLHWELLQRARYLGEPQSFHVPFYLIGEETRVTPLFDSIYNLNLIRTDKKLYPCLCVVY
ncbi:hypothetical protein ACS0TY_022030 [Phlomoides rotata]